MLGSAPVKFLTTLALGIVFLAIIIWLWQRQPQPSPPPVPEEQATDSARQISPQGLTINFKDNQVMRSKEIKIDGRANAGEFVAIASNTAQVVEKSDSGGNFKVEITLEPGLNLIEIITIPQGDSRSYQKSLTLFYNPDEKEAKSVFAGSVKSIFDTLLTLTTAAGDKNVRTSQNTEILIPEDKEESKNATVKSIRIGDYAIALGKPPEGGSKNGVSDQDSLVATSIEILRENKPLNFVQVAKIQVITPIRQNLFSAKNLQDQKIIELTLAKNSRIQIEGTTGKSSDVTRDKNA
ncbi:MAG: hypothetical protein AAB639_00810, partial [Patescibacteria group bacterium]